ncbi:MAG: Hsp20/alpha crystallin family protein [Planctomycetota bacterium]
MLLPRLREIGYLDSPFGLLTREFDRQARCAEDNYNGTTAPELASWPSIELTETQDQYRLQAEVPGLEAKNFNIQVSGELLTIAGEKIESVRSEKDHVHFTERRFGKWQRSFRLPAAADTGRIEAVLSNGILDVSIPKRSEAKPHEVKVKTL